MTFPDAKNTFLAFVISKTMILEAKISDLLIRKAGKCQKVSRDNGPPTPVQGERHISQKESKFLDVSLYSCANK